VIGYFKNYYLCKMKKVVLTILVGFMVLSGCTKKEPTRTSGIDTIDNTTFFSTTYYAYGFTFSKAAKVSTTVNPGPDIAIYVNVDNGTPRLTLQTNNLKPSFFKAGDFTDAESAQSAFDNLKTVNVTQWQEMADPILDNQVWIYRSGTETYTKFRIISTVNESRQGIDYGEITFQWVYQPDGSTTFPK
jgi:PBP1b-binding outer membrane lipoprotein LpoB